MTEKREENRTTRELGYYFHTRERADSLGHPRLDVFLRSTPTEKHFDPNKLSIAVASGEEGIELLKVHHPWSWRKEYRVCAGRVILEDRRGKKVEAFTFGGNLHIDSGDTLTTCSLTSSSPILELIEPSSVPTLLAEESEILLAERRARWEPDHKTFIERLTSVDSFVLYCVCLEIIGERVDRNSVQEDEIVPKLSQFIQAEMKTLRERNAWPAPLPPINEIL